MELVAVYETLEKKVTISFTGTNYTVTVNEEEPSEVQNGTYSVEAPVGSTVKLAVTEEDFINWRNVHNMIVSGAARYTFTVTQDVTLQMNKKGNSEIGALVEFVSDCNQVIESRNYSITSDIKVPENGPTKVGYTFMGWSLTAEEIREKIEAGETHIIVTPVYEQNTEITYVVDIYINGVKDDAQSESDVYAGTIKKVSAPRVEGKEFLYWADKAEAGTVLGYESSYSMQVNKDTEIYAVYGEEVVEVKPVVSMTNIYISSENGKNKLSFSATRDIPDSYTLVEHGMLYHTKEEITEPTEETFVFGAQGVKRFIANTTAMSGVVNLNINVTGSEDKKIIVRGYMIVKDSMGNEEIYYTDIAHTSYNEILANVAD